MTSRDQDYSDPYPNPQDPTKIWLFISWDPSSPPASTLIAVSVTVYSVPPYKKAEFIGMHQIAPGEYEYLVDFVDLLTGNPEYHNEPVTPIPYLTGRPKFVYARFPQQGGTSRATTVAL